MNICKLTGHLVTYDKDGNPKSNDSGYAICERCGSHEYYDSEEWCDRWHYFPYRFHAKINDWVYKRKFAGFFNSNVYRCRGAFQFVAIAAGLFAGFTCLSRRDSGVVLTNQERNQDAIDHFVWVLAPYNKVDNENFKLPF